MATNNHFNFSKCSIVYEYICLHNNQNTVNKILALLKGLKGYEARVLLEGV